MATNKKKRTVNYGNPKLADGLAMLAHGNAAGTHLDKRTKRSRTRQTATVQAVRDYE